MGSSSGRILATKLGVRAGWRVVVVGAPDGFVDRFELPDGVKLRRQTRGELDLILAFVTRRAELTRRLPTLCAHLAGEGLLWVAWPRRTSGVATDLTLRTVQEAGLSRGLVDNKTAALDDSWSVLRFVHGRVERR